MKPVSLVMPMAGRGSRFTRAGLLEPKPLIALEGRPFFWWAAESVRRALPVGEMIFVVLEEHCSAFNLDRNILDLYPAAEIIRIPEVTSGAAETAKLGVSFVRGDGIVVVNDCDHAFRAPSLPDVAAALETGAAACLLCFPSQSAAYSYARIAENGSVLGTVEKQVVSNHAIAGCYLFASATRFLDVYDEYRQACPYDELFVSGLANVILSRGDRVVKVDAAFHCSFGTPEERARIDPALMRRELPWLDGAA